MSNETAKTLFIHSPFASEYAGLYQELLSGVLSYQQLGNTLIRLAEQAHAFRQFDRVKELGQLLSNIPIKQYQAIGHYYLAVAANSMGNGDQDKARRLFELAVDTAPDAYKVKAILSLGALAFHKRDSDSALYFYQETIKAGRLSAAGLHAVKAISVLKSIEGSHTHAIKDLESVLPLIKYAPAHIHFDILNSYAVELGEAGRKYEARNISQVVINSPFTFAYPEWQDTANGLKEPNRSIVIFKPFKYIPRKVLPMPPREHEAEAKHESEPAQVRSLEKWKRKMAKKKKEDEEELEVEDEKDMLIWIMNAYTKDETSDYQRRKIYEAVRKVMSEPDKPEPDDDASEGA